MRGVVHVFARICKTLGIVQDFLMQLPVRSCGIIVITVKVLAKRQKQLLGDQTYRSSQYQRYLQMMKQGQTEAPARKLERTSAPERTAAPARKVWQRTANTK